LLLVAAATYTINANIYSKMPYDPRKDLFPVSILAAAPYVLCVHPALPVKSFKEFMALEKRDRDNSTTAPAEPEPARRWHSN